MESFRGQGSDSGQQLISTGNNQHVEKGMASLLQSNSTNEMTSSKDLQGATSAITVNRKIWAEKVEEEAAQVEEDYADSIQDETDDEAAQFSATPPSKDEASKVQSEQVSNSTDSVP